MLKILAAGVTGCEVCACLKYPLDTQFIVQVRVQHLAQVVFTHRFALPPLAERRLWSSLRARERRDMTVPMGIWAMSAISL